MLMQNTSHISCVEMDDSVIRHTNSVAADQGKQRAIVYLSNYCIFPRPRAGPQPRAPARGPGISGRVSRVPGHTPGPPHSLLPRR